MGCLGAAGLLPGPTLGWVTVGLGGGGFIAGLAARWRDLRTHKWELLIGALLAITLVVMGALGITGTLSAPQVGWGILGSSAIASVPLTGLFCARAWPIWHEEYRKMQERMTQPLTAHYPGLQPLLSLQNLSPTPPA